MSSFPSNTSAGTRRERSSDSVAAMTGVSGRQKNDSFQARRAATKASVGVDRMISRLAGLAAMRSEKNGVDAIAGMPARSASFMKGVWYWYPSTWLAYGPPDTDQTIRPLATSGWRRAVR